MDTEFWGVEVKKGEPFMVSPGYDMVLHLSQASLGEHKNEKGKECVSLFLNVDGKKLVLATLITNKLPQQQFDLLFDRDFELSHDWENGSVYFCGFKASKSSGEDELRSGDSDESDSEEDIVPLNFANNGKPESKAKQEKPELKAEQEKPELKAEQEKPDSKVEQEEHADAERANAANEKSDAGNDSAKIVEIQNDVNPQDDDESSYEDLMSGDDDEDVSQVLIDSHGKSDESNKETPKQIETSKKRKKRKKQPVESAADTPIGGKKPRVTQQKPDGNETTPLPANEAAKTSANNGSETTPLPGDEAGKTPANNGNEAPPLPGKPAVKPYHCKMCHKAFGTLQGVEAHTKAKHGDTDGKQS